MTWSITQRRSYLADFVDLNKNLQKAIVSGLAELERDPVTPRGNTIISHTPQDRMGKPEDLVGTLLWLVNDEASGFVTGQVIAIDGGFSAFSGV